jgi:hypothetical protein
MPREPGDPADDWLSVELEALGVRGLMTTRPGGVSEPPFDSMNLRPPELGGADADRPERVLENRRRLELRLAAVPVFLNQVHGAEVVRLRSLPAPGQPLPVADASVTTEPGIACTVLVADCLPVLLASADGRVVGATHAGWRGLAAGAIERTVDAMRSAWLEVATVAAGRRAADGNAVDALRDEPDPREMPPIVAWLGACIGPEAFEVGADVLRAFGAEPEAGHSSRHFRYLPRADGSPRWRADLAGLARERLQALGVQSVQGGGWCTVSDGARYFSYRRDGRTGRMAACVWIERDAREGVAQG